MNTWMLPAFALAITDDRAEAADMAEAMMFSSRRVPETGRMIFAITRAQEHRDDLRARHHADDELADQFASLIVDKEDVTSLPAVETLIKRLPDARRAKVEDVLKKLP